MKRIFYVVAVSLGYLTIGFFSISAVAQTRVGKFYEIDKPKGDPLFVQKTDVSVDASGNTNHASVIHSAEGKIAMTEKALFRGSKLISHEITSIQDAKQYEIEVKNDKIYFSTFEFKDGKKSDQLSAKTEGLTSNNVAGPTSQAYIREHWAQIEKGEKVGVRFNVPEIDGTVGFEFVKVGTEKINGIDVTHIKMKPSSFFISVVVKAMDLYFDKDLNLVRYFGRTPLKTTTKGKSSALDAQIDYSSEMQAIK